MQTNRRRLVLAVCIGLLSAAICWIRLTALDLVAADFTWSWRGAQFLLIGANPYHAIQPAGTYPYNDYLYYPLPALLVALPTTMLPGPLAGSVFIGVSSGLLCWGVLQQGMHRLWLFVSAPYVYAIMLVQWAPLVAAAALVTGLAPVLLAKLNIGLPVLAVFGTRTHVLLCAGSLIVSLIVLPTWSQDWLASLHSHLNYIPFVTWFGPLLLLALLRWRTRSGRLLLAMAVVPQRLVYDQLNLWLLPTTPRQSALLTAASWCGIIIGLWTQQGIWALGLTYLPALMIVLSSNTTSQGVRGQPERPGA